MGGARPITREVSEPVSLHAAAKALPAFMLSALQRWSRCPRRRSCPEGTSENVGVVFG